MNINDVESGAAYTTEDEGFVKEDEDVSEGSVKSVSKENFFKRVLIFLKEVVWELKKTVWPTRKELVSYTVIVLIFVTVMMMILAAWDFALGRLFFEIFGG